MKHNPIRTGPSLLERAAEIYDFSSGSMIAPAPEPAPAAAEAAPAAPPEPKPAEAPSIEPVKAAVVEAPEPAVVRQPSRPRAAEPGRRVAIDRDRLREAGFVLPESGAGALAEEVRLVKRQLLRAAARSGLSDSRSRSVLIASGQPNEGKTFCALNLALSIAGEQDREVLLVDGDVSKPEILSLLGVESGPGLVDALADPAADAEAFVLRTDITGLSLLPSGRQANNVPELLASERTRDVIAGLAAANPRRLILFDSPPVLLASPAGILAGHVGQVLIVVRADRTTESDLKETLGLLSACDQVALVLNGAGFAASGRRFGQYEGYEP